MTERNNNMEQNALWNFLRKYKKVGIALIIIPILLSAACYFSVPYFNQAGSSAWLSFWGGYLGSVIMAGVTLYVLEKQLSQNHYENESNRKLQLNAIAYQTYMQWINTLQDTLKIFLSSWDIRRFNEIGTLLGDITSANESIHSRLIYEKLEAIRDRANCLETELQIIMINRTDENEMGYKDSFKHLHAKLINFTHDIEILVRLSLFRMNDSFNCEVFSQEIEKHKNKFPNTENDSCRIWDIAAKFENQFISKKGDIMKELLQSFPKEQIHDLAKQLIHYETSKANKILNGTEQDK